MATNQKFATANQLSLACSHPTTPTSGCPVRYGSQTGVALTDERSDGTTSVFLGFAVFTLSVKGVDDNGNSAVAAGDALFYVDADINDGTGFLSKKSTSGYFFGFAKGTVGSGSTANIDVVHCPSPGAGTLGTGTVGATQLASDAVTTAKIAANAVTAAKLTATMATGFIPLPLTAWRVVSSNDIPASGTPDGGVLSKDTDPILERINGATDKQLRLSWVATSVLEITTEFAYPPDLDDAAAVEVHLLVYKDGNTDTSANIAVGYFEGIGDSNAGGNTAAITETAAAEKVVTITAGNVGAAPNVASVTLKPGTHANDAVYCIAAWIEYTRK